MTFGDPPCEAQVPQWISLDKAAIHPVSLPEHCYADGSMPFALDTACIYMPSLGHILCLPEDVTAFDFTACNGTVQWPQAGNRLSFEGYLVLEVSELPLRHTQDIHGSACRRSEAFRCFVA